MRLTKAEGRILLGSIAVEIESQSYRANTRARYDTPLLASTESYLQEGDRKRADELRSVRERIQNQL